MNIYEAAVAKWGPQAQLDKALEETDELREALVDYIHLAYYPDETTKELNPGYVLDHLAEEMADTEIMYEQVKTIIPQIRGMVDEWKKKKITRTWSRVKEASK